MAFRQGIYLETIKVGLYSIVWDVPREMKRLMILIFYLDIIVQYRTAQALPEDENEAVDAVSTGCTECNRWLTGRESHVMIFSLCHIPSFPRWSPFCDWERQSEQHGRVWFVVRGS